MSGTYPLMSPGKWTVSGGQTLQSVAQAVWGDAGLWYMLAEANGLKGDETLKSGTVLSIPNRLTNVHNTASTFRAYDPGRAIGNTQPTLPAPPPAPPEGGGSGCGGVAMIVTIVITAIVTAVTYGATSEFLYAELGATAATASTATSVGVGVVAGAAGGAAGAAAGQGVMMAAG